MALEDDIKMADRHVRQGERHIAEQRRRIGELERHHLPAGRADDLLQIFESLQSFHEFHLSRLLEKAERVKAAQNRDKDLIARARRALARTVRA
ncbi:hypothetical protein CK215_22055 [Mesorhizobium sp. WSM3864]|uniref:hypothetical protein n=1 Tax=Mesorhizobium sp. WSM3864 TaxID=2029404 RepID=UPI000BAE814F|nr:hypothetical protein [Mesorhizobium sp. WSM3864]PBB90340.1 hypothetical protein CK215_22055 [Mesorhizobium sp. WSM3864]